jgi:hypothetical protein
VRSERPQLAAADDGYNGLGYLGRGGRDYHPAPKVRRDRPAASHRRQHSLDLRDALDQRGGYHTPAATTGTHNFTTPGANSATNFKKTK